MAECARIRPLLGPMAEGEASPRDRLRVARHLPACTACRIVLARERRLAAMLEALDDRLPVDAEFADDVMQAIPDGPPSEPLGNPVRARRRGLRVVGTAVLLAVAGGALSRFVAVGVGSDPVPGLPRFSFEGMESLLEIFTGALRLLGFLLARIGAGFRPELPAWSDLPTLAAVTAVPLAVAVVALRTALAVLARGYVRFTRIPRAFMRLPSVLADRPNRLAAAVRFPRSSVNARRM